MMKTINQIVKYVGYIAISLSIGWFSNISGNENDFVLSISNELIPLLVTVLVFYVTVLSLILKELSEYNCDKSGDYSNIIRSMKRDLGIEVALIVVAFMCYTIRGALMDVVSVEWNYYITIFSNSVTVFTFLYFILLILDSLSGLLDIVGAPKK